MSNYNRYSNYPSTIDKLKKLPEYSDMTIEDKEKIGQYNNLLVKNALTSEEKATLARLIQELRDKMITSQDYNCVIGAITNQETFYKDGVLGDIGNIVDIAEKDVHDYCVYTKDDTKIFADNKKGEMVRTRNDFNDWFKNLVESLPPETSMALLNRMRNLEDEVRRINFKQVTVNDNIYETNDLFGGDIDIANIRGRSDGNISAGDGNTGGIKIKTINKNLFDSSRILDKSDSNIIVQNLGTGYRVTSNNSTRENAYIKESIKGFITGETYNLSCNINTIHGGGLPKIQVKNGNDIVGEINGVGQKNISFVSKSNTLDVLMYATPDCTGENDYEYENIMIEKGLYKT